MKLNNGQIQQLQKEFQTIQQLTQKLGLAIQKNKLQNSMIQCSLLSKASNNIFDVLSVEVNKYFEKEEKEEKEKEDINEHN